jgi:hypothetical protein
VAFSLRDLSVLINILKDGSSPMLSALICPKTMFSSLGMLEIFFIDIGSDAHPVIKNVIATYSNSIGR